MEKAHGWEYVRSKSNGKRKGPSAGSDRSPPTPLTPFLGTPGSALTTPVTPFLASPSVPLMDNFGDYPYGFGTPAISVHGFQEDYRRDSVTTDGSVFTYSSGHSPVEPTSFENAVTPEDTTINHNDIFNSALNGTYTSTFQQQPTPALSTGFDNFDALSFPPINTNVSNGIPHLSPGAQPDVTLFSPQQMQIDEGFNEGPTPFSAPMGDFTLFDTPHSGNMNMNATTADFFPDINNFGGQFDNTNQYDLYEDPIMPSNFNDMMGNFGNQQ